MVARLNNEYPNKEIECLDANVCPCSTMYMIHPAYLLDVLEKIRDGSVPNQIIVPKQTAKNSVLNFRTAHFTLHVYHISI